MPELDLHGTRAREARVRVTSFLNSVRSTRPGGSVRIVTGLGLHSEASPVLHRLVREMLESRTVPHVAQWRPGEDGGSFVVRLTGSGSAAHAKSSSPDRGLTDREWKNARQLEYARRRAEREAAAAADEAAEARRLERVRAEHGGRELPEWLRVPPRALEEARADRARQEEADRAEYGLTRAEYEARRRGR